MRRREGEINGGSVERGALQYYTKDHGRIRSFVGGSVSRQRATSLHGMVITPTIAVLTPAPRLHFVSEDATPLCGQKFKSALESRLSCNHGVSAKSSPPRRRCRGCRNNNNIADARARRHRPRSRRCKKQQAAPAGVTRARVPGSLPRLSQWWTITHPLVFSIFWCTRRVGTAFDPLQHLRKT